MIRDSLVSQDAIFSFRGALFIITILQDKIAEGPVKLLRAE